MPAAAEQFRHLWRDTTVGCQGRWWRYLTLPFEPVVYSLVGYRLSRACWLALGPAWPAVRTLLAPVRMVLRPFSSQLDLHYKADLGPGLRVLHPGLGVVVSAATVAGKNLILTGGNCIGTRPGTPSGGVRLGSHVTLGANAVVLGPVHIGSGAMIGAGAVVVTDVPERATAVGVPAQAISRPAP